jgi:imidazolonepropionase
MSSISIENAAQVLRPPQDGLPYLRHDRVHELVTEGGSLTTAKGEITGFAPDATAALRIDATGGAIVPGFVDCHTHLPFVGWRAHEYAMKVTGRPYEEIARAGGGIVASARSLAAAGDEQVLSQARGLAAEMLRHGTTCFEAKSGYGLSVRGEQRALRLAGKLAWDLEQEVAVTALLAHAVPPGKTADSWMDEVEEMLPTIEAQALDIYVESVAFSNEHLLRMGAFAHSYGMALRAHVEQFNPNRSVPVALDCGATSVDHLACLHPDDIAPLAASECAAVLLPGAEVLGAEYVAPGRALAEAGAICVLASDCNPGTSPIASLPLVIGLAVRRYGWTAVEALLAVTLNAAWVLGRSGSLGSLEVGKRADVLVLDGPIEHVPYRFGHNPVAAVVLNGRLVWVREDQAWRVRP